jgi:hypothetical protein
MATGTAVLDFGAAPGAAQATVVVTGQAAILTTSFVEAWMRIQDATANHTVDDHAFANIRIVAGKIVAGVGFTIYGESPDGVQVGTFNVNFVWL